MDNLDTLENQTSEVQKSPILNKGRLSSEHNFITRSLSVFTEIRPHEVRLTLALFSIIFLMLMAYYIAKPVRDSWLAVSLIGDMTRIEVKAVSGLFQSLAIIGLLPFYSKLYDKLPRGKLLIWVNVFFITLFPVFWILRPGNFMESIPCIGVIFYVWIGIFSVSVVAQLWAFAADLFDEKAGKRLFPLIALGASTGAVAGSMLSNYLIKDLSLNIYTMLLIAPLILGVTTFMLWHCDRNQAVQKKSVVQDTLPEDPEDEDQRSALRIIFGNKYILLIALFIFMLNWVVTNGENILFAAIQDAIAQTDMSGLSPEEANVAIGQATAEFYTRIYFWINLVGMLLQAFIVSRLVKYGGITSVLLIPPFVSLASYGTMSGTGGLQALTIAKTAENATNFSVGNTALHMLWLPVPKKALYKAKTAVDTAFVRTADALAAVTVIFGTRVCKITVEGFLVLNIFLITVWLLVVYLIIKERRKFADTALEVNT